MASGRRWAILAVGTFAQAATCAFIYGMPMLIPALRADEHLSLLGASVIVSAPVAGVLLTLIAWGAAADRYGERIVITSGVGAAALVHGPVALAVLLALAGAAGASVNAANGRVVMGWFPVQERGLAMGTRQTAQPLGVAMAALVLPPLARARGLHVALLTHAPKCNDDPAEVQAVYAAINSGGTASVAANLHLDTSGFNAGMAQAGAAAAALADPPPAAAVVPAPPPTA